MSGFLQHQVTHRGMTAGGEESSLTAAPAVLQLFLLCKGITSEGNLEKPSATILHLVHTRESVLDKGLMRGVVRGILYTDLHSYCASKSWHWRVEKWVLWKWRSKPYISEVNSLSWRIILFINSWIRFAKILLGLLHVCSQGMLICIFLVMPQSGCGIK